MVTKLKTFQEKMGPRPVCDHPSRFVVVTYLLPCIPSQWIGFLSLWSFTFITKFLRQVEKKFEQAKKTISLTPKTNFSIFFLRPTSRFGSSSLVSFYSVLTVVLFVKMKWNPVWWREMEWNARPDLTKRSTPKKCPSASGCPIQQWITYIK